MSTTVWRQRRDTGMDAARPGWLLVVAVASSFFYAYMPVIRILRSQWATNDTYSFGALVPIISAYLVWSRRDRLLAQRVQPEFVLGGALLLVSAGLLTLGRAAAIVALQELAMIATLASIVALTLGRGFLRVLAFPIAYLLLMLPMWEAITDPLHYPSQLFSASLAEFLLHAVGVPVHRQDVYLELPDITLEVASACSGINFLIAVMAIGVPQAQLRLRGWFPRTLVIGFALAVALLSNGLRIALIGWLTSTGVSGAVHGPGHLLQGLFVSSVGILAVLVSIEILSGRYGHADPVASAPRRPIAPGAAALCAGAVACVALVALGSRPWGAFAADTEEPTEVRLPLERWTTEPGGPPRLLAAAPSEPAVLHVRSKSGEAFDVIVTALETQGPNGERGYREVALPQGVRESQVGWAEGNRTRRVNRAIIMRGARTTELVYWYDLAGYGTPQRPLAKAYVAARALALGPSRRGPLLVLVIAEHQGNAPTALRPLVADLAEALRTWTP